MRYTILQFIRYSAVGALGTSLHYVTLFSLVNGADMDPFPASIVGSIAGAILNYLLNYRFTFESTKLHRLAMPRFFVVNVFSIALNAALMKGALEWLGVHYAVAQLISTVICLFTNFALNKLWTFAEKTSPAPELETALPPRGADLPE